jgi:hypothetical protein
MLPVLGLRTASSQFTLVNSSDLAGPAAGAF